MKLSRKVSVALLSLFMLTGVGMSLSNSSVHASHVKVTAVNHENAQKQQRSQNQPRLINKVNQKIHKHHQHSWFRDGLNGKNLAARNWVTYRESGHHWSVVSVNHRCVGYFQLEPAYLGYKNGHINLGHHHQVKAGDAYASSRYGSWVGAKRFWQAHGWY